MKQTIPFKKDITFKTKIGELTAISLDNDLTLKGEDLIVGNFYISGNYKTLAGSLEEESYSYKIPCEIAISSEYDTYDASIDIDDFYYEIINDEVLRVNITVVISNLERKDVSNEVIEDVDEDVEVLTDDVLKEESSNIKVPTHEEILEEEDIEIPRNSFYEVKESVKNQSDSYLTYKVYIFKEEDTIDDVLDKYNITKEELSDYNNIDEIIPGSKVVIPSFND